MSPVIRPETAADHAAIREVNRLAFGGEDEARLVDALREGGYARVSSPIFARGVTCLFGTQSSPASLSIFLGFCGS